MSADRNHLPVYDFSCSHIESFFLYFVDLCKELCIDISKTEELFAGRIGSKVYLYVNEELADSLQCFFPELDKADENDIPPRGKVYVSDEKHIQHVLKLAKGNQFEKENSLLLLTETEQDDDDPMNLPDNFRRVRTTKETFKVKLDNLLERWACDVAKLIVEILESLQAGIVTAKVRSSEKSLGTFTTI